MSFGQRRFFFAPLQFATLTSGERPLLPTLRPQLGLGTPLPHTEVTAADEHEIAGYPLELLAEVPGLRVFGPPATMERLGVPATARANFAIHTVPEEIDRLVEGLHDARRVFDV